MNNKEKEQSLNLADHYFKSNNYPFAEAILKKVIGFDPQSPKANELLAYIYGNQGKEDLAHNLLLKACSSSEASAEAHYYLGSSFIKLSEFEKAKESFKKALEKAGDFFEGLHDLGRACSQLGQKNEALNYFQKSLALRSDSYELFFNIGRLLDDLERHDEALINYDRAIELEREHPEVWFNKGVTLNELKRFEEALINYDQAIYLKADYAEAWSNKAVTLCNLKKFKESQSHYCKAIEINPELSEATNNLALLNLFLKNFDDGWADYSTRIKAQNFEFQVSPKVLALWDGSNKINHLLMVGEQGIGDEIFYASFINHVIQKIPRITMLTDKRLIPIFSRSFPKITFLEKNSPIKSRCFDAQIPIGNLPAILNFDPSKNHNKQKPFLLDNQEITKKLEQTSLFKNAFTCGVAWKSSNKKIGADKSINLSALKKILQTPNCKFINLQYGEVDEDIKDANELNGVEISSVKNIDLFENIDGLLSIIKACDIVITTSNVTAHLSGSIGKKTLLLTPYSQGKIWYWHDESVSTWYPSIHQFSQDRNLDWDEAINNVAKELKKEINGKN